VLGVWNTLVVQDASWFKLAPLAKPWGVWGKWLAALIDFLRNRAPSWVYTTALSPADTAAALVALNIIQQEPERRVQLWRNLDYLKWLIAQQLPILLLPSESPIICFQLKVQQTPNYWTPA